MDVPCPNCAKVFDEGSAACPHCGSEIQPNIAPQAPAPVTPLFSAFEANDHPRGIGGWLILVALGLILGPIFQLFAILTNFRAFVGPSRAIAETVIPGISALVMYQLITACALFLSEIFLVVLFFREKRSFPRYFQVWLGFSAVISLAAYTLCPHHAAMGVSYEAASKLVEKTEAQLAGACIVSVLRASLWITYFGVSRRVKATFIR